MEAKYTLDKIKFGVDSRTWERAVDLYDGGKVSDFQDTGFAFTAEVQGTNLYKVVVSKNNYSDGDCTCYLGKNNTLCKHMIAVAIYGVKDGRPLTEDEKTQHNKIKFTNKIETISQEQLDLFKAEISGAMRYIKAYNGPSKIWFAYQNSLTEGCNRLSEIFSRMPVNIKTADLIVGTLLKLDKKLQVGGVDDSDGTVGSFIEEAVDLLLCFSKADPSCAKSFEKLKGVETCFGWEEPLLKNI